MKLPPLLFICVLLAMLPACRTSPPPEFHGRWHAVNRFPAETRAISLRPDTVFAATPLDGTLKALLLRWAKESGMTLEYGIHFGESEVRPVVDEVARIQGDTKPVVDQQPEKK